MDRLQKITIKIAGKSYPMTIKRGNEELYRLAERKLSDMITVTEQQKMRDFTPQDNIAIAAFSLVVEAVDFQRRESLSNEDMEQVDRLNREVDDYMNELGE